MEAIDPSRPAEPTVTFCGGAREVTGSMHLIRADGRTVLLDCGLFLQRNAEGMQRNRTFPFDPRRLDAVILSHAHVDHSGNLPNLVRQGYSGPIYCTPPTRDLIAPLLADSARIHEEDARRANLWQSTHVPEVPALSTQADVDRTIQLCVPFRYEQEREILPGIRVRLLEAGHVLGSAMVAMTIAGPGRPARMVFTGDLGRHNMPLIPPPAPIPPADLVISESTYGGKRHEPFSRMMEAMRVLIRQTIDRGGKVLIPAFSLGRTQIVVHCLQQLRLRRWLPEVPIFVDSPLAGRITAVFRQHPDYLTAEAARQLEEPVNFVAGPLLHYVQSVDESKALNARKEPCIIVASSGMGEGGRILHHLTHNVDDPRCTVILVSYQPKDTLGWRLLETKPTVRILGREWNKWADVVILRGFSSHADHQEIVDALSPLVGQVGKVCLVHGDIESAQAIATDLEKHGLDDVTIPEPGQTISITSAEALGEAVRGSRIED